MIQVVVRPSDKPGLFNWDVRHPVIASGRSRCPLLDACRVLKRMGVGPPDEIGMFHQQANGVVSTWSLKTTVGKGAALAVEERPDKGSPRFIPYQAYGGPVHE
jgi:hypothetical protein